VCLFVCLFVCMFAYNARTNRTWLLQLENYVARAMGYEGGRVAGMDVKPYIIPGSRG